MELGITQISELIKIFPPRKFIPIKRGQWLNRFYYELSRDWNGVEPLTRLRVGIAMKRFPDHELPWLFKLCSTTKSFAKFFWWKVKITPMPKKPKKLKTLQMF